MLLYDGAASVFATAISTMPEPESLRMFGVPRRYIRAGSYASAYASFT